MANKKALLIGINYTSVPKIRLNGCIDDIINMKNMLMDAYDYDASNVTMLRDDLPNAQPPTRANILNNLKALASQSANLAEVWIHYSGHGSRVPNKSQSSGYDNLIVPVDYAQNGFIMNNELYSIIKNMQCRTILLFDSCYDATVCNLPWSYQYISPGKFIQVNNNNFVFTNPNIFMFSGSKDNQTCGDMYDAEDTDYEGVFTDAFVDCLRASHHNISFMTLYQNICIQIAKAGYTQVPVFSSSSKTPALSFMRALSTYSVPSTQVSAQQTVAGAMRSVMQGTYGSPATPSLILRSV
jgi:hypothetical protein